MSFEDYEDILAEDTFDYVEDTFIEADDLAEHAIPSPPHMAEDVEDFDIDLWQYDYWNDIDYGSDGDEIRQRALESQRAKKRRKVVPSASNSGSAAKKRRSVRKRPTGKAMSMDELPSVVLMKHAIEQRYEAQDVKTVDVRPLVPMAVLGDWREKFRDVPMFATRKPVAELEEVHDAPDDDGAIVDGEGMHEGDEGWEDEDEEEEGGPMDLDPEALKLAIQQNLKAAGINVKGMDEAAIMGMAMKMFAGGGEGGGDDLIGEMADQLLGGTRGGEDEDDEETEEDEATGFAGWIKKTAEAKAATKGSANNDLPTPTDSTGKPSASPPEKRVEKQIEEETQAGAERGQQQQRGTKRKAAEEDAILQPKRAARRFDAPTAASKARSVSSTTTVPVSAVAKRKGRKG